MLSGQAGRHGGKGAEACGVCVAGTWAPCGLVRVCGRALSSTATLFLGEMTALWVDAGRHVPLVGTSIRTAGGAVVGTFIRIACASAGPLDTPVSLRMPVWKAYRSC